MNSHFSIKKYLKSKRYFYFLVQFIIEGWFFDKMAKLLDAWDLKILSAIEFDYTLSHRVIANSIKRSKSFVTYRIKRMEDEGLISYQPLIDYSALGLTYYRVIIESPLEKKEISRFLKRSMKTVWLVEKYDQENFVIVLAAKSFGEFQKMWEDLYEQISSHVLSKDISLAYRVYHLPVSFLTKSKRKDLFVTGASKTQMLNKDEQLLLDILVDEPTISQQSLSKRLKLSVNTVKKILNNLQKNNVLLAYQTLINKEKLGIRHYKLFLSYDFTLQNKNILINLLKNHSNVVYITETSYHHDLECELFVSEDDSFERILRDLKSSFSFKRVVVSQMKSEEKLF